MASSADAATTARLGRASAHGGRASAHGDKQRGPKKSPPNDGLFRGNLSQFPLPTSLYHYMPPFVNRRSCS